MNKVQKIIISFMTVLGLVALPLAPAVANADSTNCSSAADCISQGTSKVGGDQNQPKLEDQIKIIVNVLLFILGAIAVIMIIIGGIRYTTSNGESAQIQSAKNTILYAVVGLVVAILAYAIVNFVVGAFKGNG